MVHFSLSMAASLNGASSLHEVAREEDETQQAPPQVSAESRTQRNAIVPQVFIHVEEFCNTCY